MGEKQALEDHIHQITSELSAIKRALNASELENQQKQALIDQSTSDLNRLRSILEKDFSEISELEIYKNKPVWIVPGRISISVSLFLSDSVYISITNGPNGEWVRLSERVDINYDQKKCFIIPNHIWEPEAIFSFACDPIPKRKS